jgi:hypothetical protein
MVRPEPVNIGFCGVWRNSAEERDKDPLSAYHWQLNIDHWQFSAEMVNVQLSFPDPRDFAVRMDAVIILASSMFS